MMRVSGSEITHAQAKFAVAQKQPHIELSRLLSGEARGADFIDERTWITVDARVNGRAKERNGRASETIVYPEAK